MNMWRRLFLSLAVAFGLFAAVAGEAMAQEPPALGRLAAANQRHERGEFTEAVQHYEAVIGMGYRDPVVYYNLGNAYLESGDLGRAILNYLRAEELSPRDPDIFENLAVARSRTVDQLEAEGDTLVASVANFGGRWANTAEFAVAALLLWAVAGTMVVALILRPAMRLRAVLRSGTVVAVVVMLVPLVLLLSMLYSDPYDNTGVVTAGDGRGAERTGDTVQRGVRPAQRRPSAAGGLPPRLAAGRPPRRRAPGLAPGPRHRGRGPGRRWEIGPFNCHPERSEGPF